MIKLFLALAVGVLLLGCVSQQPSSPGEVQASTSWAEYENSVPENLTVAFIADQGVGSASRAVLRMVREEGADMVLHQGDLGYLGGPDAWDRMVSGILGPDFPYFASIGNHDVDAWAGYQQKLLARLSRIEGAACTGELGVKSACTYGGLFFILSGAGTTGSGHGAYIREQLSSDRHLWRVCSWHKNQRLMQVGGKRDEVGWAPYEECRRGGAVIATGHEHSYSRTHLMSSFEDQRVASHVLRIEKGRTFAFVSGLGGRSIRGQSGIAFKDWWAAVYTSEQGANYGALFCTFNESKAHCYFKDIDGEIPDEFNMTSEVF